MRILVRIKRGWLASPAEGFEGGMTLRKAIGFTRASRASAEPFLRKLGNSPEFRVFVQQRGADLLGGGSNQGLRERQGMACLYARGALQ